MRTRALFTLIFIAFVLTLPVGCSIFIAPQRTARVQINGIGNHVNEIVVFLDDLTDTDLDIQLTENYAVRLDLQWLWSQEFTLFEPEPLDRQNPPLLSPLVSCKYRF